MISIPNYRGRTRWTTMLIYLASLIFCLHYSLILNSKRYSTFLEMKDTIFKLPNLSLCLPLYIHYDLNCTAIESESIRNGCIKFESLYNFYSNESIKRNPNQILNYAIKLKINNSYEVSSNFQFTDYYLNFNYLCMKYKPIANDNRIKEEFIDKDTDLNKIQVFNNFKLPTIVFLHEENFIYFFYKYFFRQNCKIFKKCEFFTFLIEQFKFKFLKYPYGTKCLEYEKLELNYTNHIDHEDIGLVECMKKKGKQFSLYFFSLNDTKHLVYLPTNYASTQELAALPTTDLFKNCVAKFYQKDCTQTLHMILRQVNTLKDHLIFRFKVSSKIIEEKEFSSDFDYYFQLIGFISLIFGISLNSSLSYLNLFLTIKFNLKIQVLNAIFIFKYFLLFTSLFIVLSKSFEMFYQYSHQKIYSVSYYDFLFNNKDINIYICFPLAITMKMASLQIDNQTNLKQLTDDLLDRLTLKQLIEHRIDLSDLIEKIYLTDGRKNDELQIDDYINETFLLAQYEIEHIYSKCFNYHIKLNLTSYQKLLKSTGLRIRLKTNYTSFFFTTIDQRVTSDDTKLTENDFISRYVYLHNRYECKNYYNENFQNFTCLTQQDCKCIFINNLN